MLKYLLQEPIKIIDTSYDHKKFQVQGIHIENKFIVMVYYMYINNFWVSQ